MAFETREDGAGRHIVVNGVDTRTPAATLGQLLALMDLTDAHVATALNGEFVPAPARDAAMLRAGDRVEIVAPRQGG